MRKSSKPIEIDESCGLADCELMLRGGALLDQAGRKIKLPPRAEALGYAMAMMEKRLR